MLCGCCLCLGSPGFGSAVPLKDPAPSSLPPAVRMQSSCSPHAVRPAPEALGDAPAHAVVVDLEAPHAPDCAKGLWNGPMQGVVLNLHLGQPRQRRELRGQRAGELGAARRGEGARRAEERGGRVRGGRRERGEKGARTETRVGRFWPAAAPQSAPRFNPLSTGSMQQSKCSPRTRLYDRSSSSTWGLHTEIQVGTGPVRWPPSTSNSRSQRRRQSSLSIVCRLCVDCVLFARCFCECVRMS